MKIQTYDMNAYKLNLLKTDKFKMIKVFINFRKPVEKKDMTERNFLCDLLTESTNKYKTRKELSLELEDLYGSYIVAGNLRRGNYTETHFKLSTLSDKYTEKGNFNKAFKILIDIIFNPNIKNKAFSEKDFNLIKELIKTEIDAEKSDKMAYSSARGLEESDDEGIYSLRKSGYIEDLNEITPKSLYKAYGQMLKSDLVDITIIGDIDFSNMKKLINESINIKTIKNFKKSIIIKNHSIRRKIKNVTEHSDVEQARLTVISKINDMTELEREYVSPIYNKILGEMNLSILQKTIREKHGLAYYVFSKIHLLSSIIEIKTGINQKNYSKTYKIIRKALNDIRKGNFSEKLVEMAKKEIISNIKYKNDSEEFLASEFSINMMIYNEERKEEIKEVEKITKEDIVRFAKKVHPDTSFLLRKEC